MVWSRDEQTGETELKPIAQTFERTSTTLALTFSNGETIETTSEHPFYVVGRGFVKAGELGIGSSIVTRAGPSLALRAATAGAAQTVYNFEVADYHTYFVGHGEVWVHNTYLTAAQQAQINRIDANIRDHLRPEDFSGALADLQGTPILKGNGVPWKHDQEVSNAYGGLKRAVVSLNRSLTNPNLDAAARQIIEGKVAEAESMMRRVEDLWAPYPNHPIQLRNYLMTNYDLNKSIEELEGEVWPPPNYSSFLVLRCHDLRKKPVQDFSVEDLRLMIGQNVGLKFLIPVAINVLEKNPFFSGDHYFGDLLCAVLSVEKKFWMENEPQYYRFLEVTGGLDYSLRIVIENLKKFEEEVNL